MPKNRGFRKKWGVKSPPGEYITCICAGKRHRIWASLRGHNSNLPKTSFFGSFTTLRCSPHQMGLVCPHEPSLRYDSHHGHHDKHNGRRALRPHALGSHAPGERLLRPARLAWRAQRRRAYGHASRGSRPTRPGPGRCLPAHGGPRLAWARLGRGPSLPERPGRALCQGHRLPGRGGPDLSLLLHQVRAPCRDRAPRLGRHLRVSGHVPQPRVRRNRTQVCGETAGNAPSRPRRTGQFHPPDPAYRETGRSVHPGHCMPSH